MAGPYELQSPKDIAMEYGGNKQKIAQAAQMGMIDPTSAVLAGMFIDKMRMAQQEEMAPQSTVAQDVMAAPQMAAGLGATPQAAMAPQMPQQMPTEAGVAALPVPEDMVADAYAGGGIVAFANGGDTSPFGRDIEGLLQSTGVRGYMDAAERRREENRLRNLLRQQYGRQAGPFGYFMSQSPEERAKAQDIASRLNTMSAEEMQQLLGMPTAASSIESRIAQAERGEGPDVSRPGGIRQDIPLPGQAAAATQPQGQMGQPTGLPSVMSAADQLKRIDELNKLAGVSEDPDAAIREMITKQRAESKEARGEANAMALIAAGLGIAGGDSPYALQNLKGAIPALQQLGVDKRDIRKLDRESDKIEADLARAADARKRGKVEKAIELEDKAYGRQLELRRTVAAEASANRPSQFSEMLAAYQKDPEGFTKMMQSKGTGSESAAINRARYALQDINDQLMTMKRDDPKRKELEARRSALLDSLMGGGSSAGTGKTIQFSDI
jgi:hypothetical protein